MTIEEAREELHKLKQFREGEDSYGCIRLLARAVIALSEDFEARLEDVEAQLGENLE